MAEWLKAAVLKTVRGESSSRVRIPLSPQTNVVRQEEQTVWETVWGFEARLSWIMSLRNNPANWGTETVSFESLDQSCLYSKYG